MCFSACFSLIKLLQSYAVIVKTHVQINKGTFLELHSKTTEVGGDLFFVFEM